ncbi:hypothetical protein YC2023_049832 [Brassica napus]
MKKFNKHCRRRLSIKSSRRLKGEYTKRATSDDIRLCSKYSRKRKLIKPDLKELLESDKNEEFKTKRERLPLSYLSYLSETLILIGAAQPVADSGESVAVVTGCLPLNLLCLSPFSAGFISLLFVSPIYLLLWFPFLHRRHCSVVRDLEQWVGFGGSSEGLTSRHRSDLPDLLSMEDDCASVGVLRSPLIPPAFVSWSRRQVSSFSVGGLSSLRSLLQIHRCFHHQ